MINKDESINIVLRDINGKRFTITFASVEEFQGFEWTEYDDKIYEILLVVWCKCCIYTALGHESLSFEELRGYFA